MQTGLSRAVTNSARADAQAPLADHAYGADRALRFIEDKLHVGLWSWEFSTGNVEWSSAARRLLGLESTGPARSFADFIATIHPDDRPRAGEIEALAARGVPIERNFRLTSGCGRVRWVEFNGEALVDRDGKFSTMVGTLLDVTSRQEELQTLRFDAERFQALLAALSEIALIVAPDGTLIDVLEPNSRVRSLVSGTTSRSWLEFVHPDDRPNVEAKWRTAVADGRPFSVDFRTRRSRTEFRWTSARGAPTRDADGSIRDWVIVTIDTHAAKVWPNRSDNGRLITGAQIRAARGILNWSVRDLAVATGLSTAVIRRLEETDGFSSLPDFGLEAVRDAFERAGVELLFPPVGKPGIRPR